ncbi:uncharacterized protein LOC120543671 isoform X2 [Perca fluviatilis]|uniref:uncharacterized protein LOC120543671 isoform X2 n=1 Tax=Perca fluviatilis TaxID=8168 RepID=UPI001962F0BC|nr:uncharacterized protein LOC120543671 isoform X2 [Perca fluviatilis]
MALMNLEAKWKTALSSILEELTDSQFRKMLLNLVKIPQGVKDGKAREDIPYLLVQYYGTEDSISVIDKEMKNIPRHDAAVQEPLRPFVEKLKTKRQGKKGMTRKLSIDFGSVAKKLKLSADQLKSCQPDQMDRVGAVETEKKTEEQDLSLKPVESIKTFKVPSAAVQTGRIQIMGIKKSNKTNTHLVVEFNKRKRNVFVTTRLLANAFGLKVDDDFERRLRYQMPLTAEAKLQGKKVTDIKKMLKLLEAKWETALSSILEELTEEEFRKMLFNLVKIPQGVKTGKAREYIPDLIVQHYGTEGSISVIDEIMKKIPRNDAKVQKLLHPFVEELKKRLEEKVYSIKEVKSFPDQTDVGVKGKVTKINHVEKIQLKSTKKIKRQQFQLKDETDPIEIFMLGDSTELCKGLSVGDVVMVTNIKTSHYTRPISLKSTVYTRIEKMGPVGAVKTKKKTRSRSVPKASQNLLDGRLEWMTSKCASTSGSGTRKPKPAAGFSGELMPEPFASAVDCIGWTELQPVVNTVDEVQTYSFQCDAGHFECSVSALRWVCEEKLSFRYQFCSWEEHRVRLSATTYMPAGPLLNITVTAGKMEEVHLPHWICVDHNSKMSDNFAVLHIDTCGDVWRKVSEVTRCHVKLLQPTFSPISVVIRRIFGFPVKVFYNVLIYMKKHQAALTLHVYLVPPDEFLKQEVEKMENSCGSVRIIKPGPDRPMQLGDHYSLTTDKMDAKIQPSIRELRDDSTNLFEVFIRNADSDVPLRLESEQTTIWTCTIYKENYLSTNPTPGPSGAIQQRNVPADDSVPTEDRDPSEDSVPAEKKLFSVRTEFIGRVSDDVLNQLLDKLLEHRIINDGEMQSIRTTARADKAREVIDTVRRKGTEPSSLLIAVLRELDLCLSKVLKLS